MMTMETLHPQYLKTKDGRSAFVVLPAEEFEALIEDYNDLTVIEERRNEPTISLEDLKQSLSADDADKIDDKADGQCPITHRG